MKAKKIFMTVVSLLIVASMLFAVSACDKDGKQVPVESVEMDRGTLTLNIGETRSLSALVMPANATDKAEKWVSSNPSVASVDDKGAVTGVSEGKATIKVTIGGKSDTCSVTVNDNSGDVIPVTGISLSKSVLNLDPKDTEKLTVTFNPTDATNKDVTWRSTDTNVATVSADGTVTAVAGGTTVIISTAYGTEITDYCVVKVSGPAAVTERPLYVEKVDSLTGRDDFIMGMDASAVPSLEKAGVTYKDFDGQTKDVFTILKSNGITDIRIRIWNDPKDASGKSYGGGNCDVNNAVEIATRCQKVGLGVIIDFHYSDFWADPGKQKAPKAWSSLSTEEIATKIYDFTKESLQAIKATNVKITMVQIGNETNSGMAGSSDWAVICNYMNQGSKAVREVTGTVASGGAKVAVHFTNPEKSVPLSRAGTLNQYKVDYDVLGTSYYPYWHGTLSNLKDQLKRVHDQYGKEVMVLETSYAFTYEDADGTGNTALQTITQPVTVQGQSNAVRSVIETVADLGNYGLGVCYWEGTWLAASTSTDGDTNRAICEEYGCGWASQYAHGYDSSAPSTQSGGCVIDNQAFWLSDGTPNESLKVFKLVREGQMGDIKVDVLYSQEDYYTVNVGTITLPSTVKVVFNNGSSLDVTAYWAVTAEELEQYIQTVGTHEIVGTTQYGGTCYFYAWVMNPNLLTDGSFEDAQGYVDDTKGVKAVAGWDVSYKGGTKDLQLYASTNESNARMGKQSFHFWDGATVQFTLSQKLTLAQLKDTGKFGGYFEIQGGDGVNVDVHMYVIITYTNGQTKTVEGNKLTEFAGWQNWQRTGVSGIDIDSTVASVEVGISVYAEFAGDGPWGNIDNAQFYFEG